MFKVQRLLGETLLKARIAISFLVLCFAAPILLSAQATDCNDPHASPDANAWAQREWESKSSPVYADATKLARDLTNRGITVVCIRRSKEEHRFEGQKGAAWFKSNQGIFEVWFLPSSETFADLEVISQQKNGRYIYSFRGTPRISSTTDSSKPIYFIKYRNALFNVWGNQQLAASIQTAFQEP